MKENYSLGPIIKLSISVISTLSLLWIFLRALLFPVKYSDFVFNIGFLVFVIEFFSLIFTVLIVEMKKIYKQKISQDDKYKQMGKLFIPILLLIGWLTMWSYFAAKNYTLLIIFVLSFINKFYGHLSGQQEINLKKEVLRPIIIMFCVIIPVALTDIIWELIFPYGPEVWALKPEGLEISGSIQGIFVAMIIYYAILEFLSIKDFLKFYKKASVK